MELYIRNYAIINIGGVDIWITETLVNTWIIMAVLVAAAVVVRIALRGTLKEVPTGLQNAVEAVVETFNNFVRNSAGPKFMYLGNWYFMVVIFIITANISGIFGLRAPTADLATPAAFAFATFILIQATAVRERGGKYLKNFINPLNIIGELARPVSLSFRLFGNILAGTIIMTLYYGLTPRLVHLGIPIFLHAFFDLFAGAMQTYIFCILSLTFIGTAADATDDA